MTMIRSGRVARLTTMHPARFHFQPAGTDDWVSVVVNRPITTGDKLWTDNTTHALSCAYDSATVTLPAILAFPFSILADNTTQIQLDSQARCGFA